MLRKSVETRDWLNCLEPRSVRAVMKRVVEELATIEATMGDLYEAGNRTAASSDSSRKTYISNNLASSKQQQFRSNWSNYTPTQLENSFVSNIHRLFSERVEIFGSVEFSKVSILTGIVKISLKVSLKKRLYLGNQKHYSFFFTDTDGMRSTENVQSLRSAADPSGCPLFADESLAFRFG